VSGVSDIPRAVEAVFVLMLYVDAGPGRTITREFDSKEACEISAQALERRLTGTPVYWFCTPKGRVIRL
jgi:hypothetical protein